jgi:hypothetical protein
MGSFAWVLLDGSGSELRSTQAFESRDEAEAWLGEEWRALLSEGAEQVSLRSGDEELYRMGLSEQ